MPLKTRSFADILKMNLQLTQEFLMHRIFGGDPQGKVKLLLEYAGERKEVADPWYTGDFEITYRDILNGCNGILSTLGEVK